MNPVIEVRGLTQRYGVNLAVDEVELTVTKGDICGLLVVNGAGKTTSVECLQPLRTAGTHVRARLDSQLQTAALPDRLQDEKAVRHFGYGDRRSADARRRLFIALALLKGPAVASFDEFDQGLDPLARGDVWGVPPSLDTAPRFKRRTPRVGSMSPITVDDTPGQRRPMGSREDSRAEPSRHHPMPHRDVCR